MEKKRFKPERTVSKMTKQRRKDLKKALKVRFNEVRILEKKLAEKYR